MPRGRTARIAWIAIVAGLAPFGAIADDRESTDTSRPSPKESRPAEQDDPEPAKPAYSVPEDRAITNEDLEAMMRSLSPLDAQAGVYQAPASAQPAAPPAAPSGATGKKDGEATGAKPAPKSPSVADAERKVADLQARVAMLEKAVLAVKNPLLPRTWTTPDSMKDQDQESGYENLDNIGRLGQRETELAAARDELGQARQELARLGGGDDDSP